MSDTAPVARESATKCISLAIDFKPGFDLDTFSQAMVRWYRLLKAIGENVAPDARLAMAVEAIEFRPATETETGTVKVTVRLSGTNKRTRTRKARQDVLPLEVTA